MLPELNDRIGTLHTARGFSSFKFLPFRHDEVVALKTFESDEIAQTYITVLNIRTGEVLLDDTLIEGVQHKYISYTSLALICSGSKELSLRSCTSVIN